MARDNFSKSVIETLKTRVANRCSNPNHRGPTSGPSSNGKVINIGIAAHISAASTGGPRYDNTLTTEDRKSINNAIWLCSNCSIDIDRDVNRYPVELLKEWKKIAENTARNELGKILPSNNETIDTVSAALTGYPKSFIANAISNVHQATEKSLELLDPRFSVKSLHSHGQTSFEITPNETVLLPMKLNTITAKEYLEKQLQLFEHGTEFKLNSDSMTIEGSKLFDNIFESKDTTLNFASRKIKATQKLWLIQKDTNLIYSFDDIQGVISYGTKSFTFKGTACNELFSIHFHKPLDANSNSSNFKISLCLDQWEELNISFLPYLEKLSSFFKKINQGWELFTSLEINGIKVLSSSEITTGKSNYMFKKYIKEYTGSYATLRMPR